jgi:hypothetical protein
MNQTKKRVKNKKELQEFPKIIKIKDNQTT